MSDGLAGRVVALIGSGTEAERAVVVACAEAGAAIALGTQETAQAQEFAMNSIANEVWAIGRDHLVRVMDAASATDITSFADEVWDRLGRCDLVFACHDVAASAPIEELSADEWEVTIRANLTAPFLAAQAFARLMERQGTGRVVVVAGVRPTADAAYVAARAGLREAVRLMNSYWSVHGVSLSSVDEVPSGGGGRVPGDRYVAQPRRRTFRLTGQTRWRRLPSPTGGLRMIRALEAAFGWSALPRANRFRDSAA